MHCEYAEMLFQEFAENISIVSPEIAGTWNSLSAFAVMIINTITPVLWSRGSEVSR